MSRVDLAELDFVSPEVQECPFSVYRQLQDEAPVWQMPGTNVFVVTRYNDIREIIRDPARFSSSFSALLNAGFEFPARRITLRRREKSKGGITSNLCT